MEWLNYHHLYYFWMVVREGTVSGASRKLRLAQQTVSGQLKELESALNVRLFDRRGNRLVLTDTGQHVYGYANEIFALGRQLQESLAAGLTRRARLLVGISDVVPKLVAQRLLEPALRSDDALHLVCSEDRHERLLADLALLQLDVVLSDTPVGADSNFRAHNHLLGESRVSLFAKPKLAQRLRQNFPASLDGESLLLPIEQTSLRRGLTRWFDKHRLQPRVRAEFQDSALLTAMGQAGEGIFAAPSIIQEEVMRQHRVAVIAELDDVRERFYAITADRRIANPAVRALTERARAELFRSQL